ncbi:hypothetical protein NF865_04520 [Thermococcus aggregans]|uniref:Uncharacterized protein n=1 Tax=Thermococcus aggregans TaxID=110163 RepID=A0A9E7MZ11_THEAG|nr:hypothetical protein [Thermococcus aggregans]USS41449.1 hypothetical protein NF865_04520 [Thermococcus aggregans]
MILHYLLFGGLQMENLENEDRFMIYNVDGKSIMVKARLSEEFDFVCSEEECGKRLELHGVIKIVPLQEYWKVLKETVNENEEFHVIETLNPIPLIFEGTVNGKRVKLPVETLQSLARRFVRNFLDL